MIIFYILSKISFRKPKGLSDARVPSITKKRKWFCSKMFVKIHKVSYVNI